MSVCDYMHGCVFVHMCTCVFVHMDKHVKCVSVYWPHMTVCVSMCLYLCPHVRVCASVCVRTSVPVSLPFQPSTLAQAPLPTFCGCLSLPGLLLFLPRDKGVPLSC